MDDIDVCTRDKGENLDHMRQVFALLSRHNLKLSVRKCRFGRTDYLRELRTFQWTIKARPGPAKIAAVKQWSLPTTEK